jgi:hypothetical protein
MDIIIKIIKVLTANVIYENARSFMRLSNVVNIFTKDLIAVTNIPGRLV